MRPEADRRPNRLISEKSPYLLQHAYNPVDWYPWGEEAFEKARTEDRPVFLSIGYSTCHWCHVMERESFEDPEIARMMNEAFVCIKVDREERPDIDKVYMTACQMMTGSGGWPLSIIITPDKKPFFATTYIPKESIFSRIGMKELIPNVRNIWMYQRDKVEDISDRVGSALKETDRTEAEENPDITILDEAFERLSDSFDERYGGFGDAPKFPTPEKLAFLLHYWKRTGKERALRIVEETLTQMRRGGIHDHIGQGFHRYSTDRAWILPHFEKMLYDQALMSIAYTEAYQATKKDEYAQTVREILEYVTRQMTSPDGAFYSAEDADSEGVEGKHYLWTLDEIEQVLSPREARAFAKVFNMTSYGNIGEGRENGESKSNVLYLTGPLNEMASQMDMTTEELRDVLAIASKKLFDLREKRIRPQRDDKVLADWNGLMIAAFAKAAQAFGCKGYEKSAVRAAEFFLNNMRHSNGRLYHRFRDGEAAVEGFLDDYAFLIWGFIELYESSFDTKFLQDAMNMTRTMIDLFWDDSEGGFFFTTADAEEVVVRKKESHDGDLPSGNSVAMLDLLKLSHLTDDLELERMAYRVARRFSREVSTMPEAYTQSLIALDFAFGPSFDVVIAGDPENSGTKVMIRTLREGFLPNLVVILNPTMGGGSAPVLAKTIAGKLAIDGETTAYVCSNRSCREPTTDADTMMKMLKNG